MVHVWKSEDNFGGSVLPFYYMGPETECSLPAWHQAPLPTENLTVQDFIIVSEIFKTCDLISPNAKYVFLLYEAFTCWYYLNTRKGSVVKDSYY